jgi:hypothetical protein
MRKATDFAAVRAGVPSANPRPRLVGEGFQRFPEVLWQCFPAFPKFLSCSNIFLLCCAGDGTQGLVHARQAFQDLKPKMAVDLKSSLPSAGIVGVSWVWCKLFFFF